MSEIVTSITNGVPVESVNPSLYGNLYPYLQMKCRNLCRDRNYMALKFVEDAMNSIQDHFVQVEADMIKQEEKYRRLKNIKLDSQPKRKHAKTHFVLQMKKWKKAFNLH